MLAARRDPLHLLGERPHASSLSSSDEEICAAGERGATSRATVRVEAARRPRPAKIAKAVTSRRRVLQRIGSRQGEELRGVELYSP